MKYSVKISPVGTRNQSRVTIHLRRVLGQGAGNTIQSLVRNGGIVRDNLTKAEADRIAGQLRNLGAVVEVSKTTSGEPEKGYRLKLISAEDKKITVIKEVRKITGLGLKEAKELVDTLGEVGIYSTKKEADKVKRILTSVGAKVSVNKLGSSVEDPNPNDPDNSDKKPSLPLGKPLRLLVLDENDQPLQKARIAIKTSDKGFDEAMNTIISDDQGLAVFPDFSNMVLDFFEELPPIRFEVSKIDTRFTTIHQAFDWKTYINFPDTRFLVQIKTKDVVTDHDAFIVFGQVLLSTGQPVEACTVRAFDRDLRSEQLLGETRTDEMGIYRIAYQSIHLRNQLKERADLITKVYNSVGNLITESSIHFNVDFEQEINITIPENINTIASKYEVLVSKIKPLHEGVAHSEFNSEDVFYLSNKTGYPSSEINLLVVASQLSDKTELSSDIFWGVGISNLDILEAVEKNDAPELFIAILNELPPMKVIDAFESAVSDNIIPSTLQNDKDSIKEKLTEIIYSSR